jgi:hypothetical protein
LPWIYSIFYFLPAFLVAQEKLGQSQKETSVIWLTYSLQLGTTVRTVHTVHISPLLQRMKNTYFRFIFYFSAVPAVSSYSLILTSLTPFPFNFLFIFYLFPLLINLLSVYTHSTNLLSTSLVILLAVNTCALIFFVFQIIFLLSSPFFLHISITVHLFCLISTLFVLFYFLSTPHHSFL